MLQSVPVFEEFSGRRAQRVTGFEFVQICWILRRNPISQAALALLVAFPAMLLQRHLGFIKRCCCPEGLKQACGVLRHPEVRTLVGFNAALSACEKAKRWRTVLQLMWDMGSQSHLAG